MIEKSSEIIIDDECDCLIAWGFKCSERAEFLIENLESPPEYAIMCEKHKDGFIREYSRTIRYSLHPYSVAKNIELEKNVLKFRENQRTELIDKIEQNS